MSVYSRPKKAILIVSSILLIWLLLGSSTAQAHGKELTLNVASFAPDDARPLTRLFRAQILHADDLDPVSDAKVLLSASREGGGPKVDDQFLLPLNEPGLYAVEVDFPLFGSWNMTLKVVERGEGEVSFTEELSPSAPDRDITEARQQVLSIFFSFNWSDAAAILVRVIHALASGVWFVFTALILTSLWLLSPSSRADLFKKLSRVFAPVSYASLVLLLLTGVYTGIYSAPVGPPGIFDFDVMFRIPFGTEYLLTIGFKALVLVVFAGVTSHIARSLRLASVYSAGQSSAVTPQRSLSDAEKVLLRLSTANAILGVLLVAAISIAIYLHYISHLAVFVPG
ncbi:MAG: hypothetical protein H8E48_07275 [Chloroflexi bacterium]|nr:hypothetical protein [Chloroflexota bacterium]